MLRTSVLLFFVLANGVTAKPLNPWDELANGADQNGWVSIDDKGMASWGVEVEPPEDMDETSFDIDPSMKIWKSVQSEQSNQYQMAEDDLDDLQHPSTENLLNVYVKNVQDALLADDMQVEDSPDNQETEDRNDLEQSQFMEPEEDWDGVYHSEKDVDKYLAPLVVGYEGEPVVRAVHSEPEKDEDDMYHADVDSGMLLVQLEPAVMAENQGRLYMEPEEDMDDIYHKDVPEMIPFNSEVDPATVDWPPKKHTQPEEDLDVVYHD
ncbi:uncharacterized protein [Eucyclogobius newberryi]|uniref:uncharacterized protein n=1 Tax=Eucyclogobius newberryi TaxID=166745 RepID=UPI003B5ADC03